MTLTPHECYQALAARDPRFDGQFFVGVRTTGIYCRSICAARTPRASSCRFFATAAAAEGQGFRPCLRCRPELAPGACADSLPAALYIAIRQRALQAETNLDELAEHAGYSPRQLRRLMVQHFGVTPVEIAQTERLLFAKKLLQETALPMTQVAMSAGFRSLRRFNALFLARYGMAPSALRRQAAGANLPADMLELRLSFRPPLAWRELLAYYAHRAVPGVEAVDEARTTYVRTIRFGETTGWLRVRLVPDTNTLAVSLPATLARHAWAIVGRLRAMFDLDANPQAIDFYLARDPVLARSTQRHPGLRVPGAWCPFDLAVRAILGQQVSVAGATTLAGRLATRFGEPLSTPHAALHRLAVTPEQLAAASLSDLASIGLPQARAASLQALAQAALAGALDFPPGASVEEVVARLCTIRGVGEWTAQYIAMRALRFPDAFPAADLGVRKALAAPGAPLPTERATLARAEPWRPWRAYATLHLWQSLHDQPPTQPQP